MGNTEQEPLITTGETRREIDALWDSVKELDIKFEASRKEVVVMSTQISYMVTILERLDRGNMSQAPVCAVRGARLDNIEKRVEEEAEKSSRVDERVTDLEASNRILKWLLGIATAILTTVGGERLVTTLTK